MSAGHLDKAATKTPTNSAILFIYFMKNAQQDIKTSLILFAVAAVAGFYMFFQDLRGKFSPTWMAVVHGLVAVAGFVFLLMAVI